MTYVHIQIIIMLTTVVVYLPLCLPVDEFEGGVEEPAHLRERPLLVNAKEEVWGWGCLERHIHQLSMSTKQDESLKGHSKACVFI